MYFIININKNLKQFSANSRPLSLNTISVLRPLIKYPVTVVILLLVGYTQVFANLYRATTASLIKKGSPSTHFQAHVQTTGVEEIYFEEEEVEEDDRLSLKKHFVDNSVFLYTRVLAYIHQESTSYSYISRYFSRHASFQSSYLVFRVFRL